MTRIQTALIVPATLETRDAVTMLGGVATTERVSQKSANRLAEIAAMFADDLSWVERELQSTSAEGLANATLAAKHLLDAGGKRIRPLCVLLSSSCFSGVTPVAKELAAVAELVHLATLLHDDVVDDGMERRGKPPARLLYGNAVSVLAGDLLLTHALEKTSQVIGGDTLADLFRTLRRLVDGEVVQLRGRVALDLNEATYMRIVEDKTASLFAWAARAGARAGGAEEAHVEALGAFGESVGVAFQMVDDLLDYAGDPAETGKQLASDLGEGKPTLPLLYWLRKDPSGESLLHAARAGELDAATRVLERVRSSGAAAEVRAAASLKVNEALAYLEKVPARSNARQCLADVARELTERRA